MIRVVLLGGGNLASHLAIQLSNSDRVELVQIYNRTLAHITDKQNLAPLTDSLDSLSPADVYIIATSDSAIETISNKLNNIEGLVVHTSGATTIKKLRNSRTGVFYPLQSFSKDSYVDFKNIPFCIETNTHKDYSLLEELALSLSLNVYSLNSNQRKKLHIAAVFVNNFVNHMYSMGAEICKENNIPFEVLYPLILETAEKIQHISPRDAQTGPAIRKDKKTVALHEKELTADQLKIYQLLSVAISNKK